ncbi:hypothetical protein ACFLT0_00150 [Chloroflexota bacterium]
MIIAATEHARNQGRRKIVRRRTIALTTAECVDFVVIDLGVIEVIGEGAPAKRSGFMLDNRRGTGSH